MTSEVCGKGVAVSHSEVELRGTDWQMRWRKQDWGHWQSMRMSNELRAKGVGECQGPYCLRERTTVSKKAL